jgi:hypothetical protein
VEPQPSITIALQAPAKLVEKLVQLVEKLVQLVQLVEKQAAGCLPGAWCRRTSRRLFDP